MVLVVPAAAAHRALHGDVVEQAAQRGHRPVAQAVARRQEAAENPGAAIEPAQRHLTPGLPGRGDHGGLPAPAGVAPGLVAGLVADVLGAHPAQDQPLVALETRRHHVHPAVLRVEVPRPALGVAAVLLSGELRAGVHPGVAVVVGAPDLGPHHVAETLIDDRVQIQGVAHPQQVRRDHRADAAAQQAGVVAVPVAPKLPGVAAVGAGGAVVDDPVGGVAGADQDHRGAPVADPDPVPGEGVAEHRHEVAVGGAHGGAEVGAQHPEPVGDSRPGEVGDFSAGGDDGGHASEGSGGFRRRRSRQLFR